DHQEHSEHHGVHEPHESPWVMTVPLIILAVLSTLGGFMGVPYALGSLFSDHPTNYIEQTLDPVIAKAPGAAHEPAGEHAAEPESSHVGLSPPPQPHDGAPAFAPLGEETAEHHSPETIRAERLLTVVSVIIAALGIAVGWFIFRKRPLLQLPRILENKYYVDEAYNAAI